MSVEEAIRVRRSVRQYQQKAVEPEKLEALIEAVRLAASASNSQPWKLILVDDQVIRKQVALATFSDMVAFNKFALEAPVIAVLTVEPHAIITQIGGWLKKRPYYLIDIGIAAAQFCLRATELGLGTCMLGWFDEAAIKRILHVPRGTRIGLVITLGYGEEPPAVHAKTRKAASEMSSRNQY
jgi:nitroreductase